MSRATWNGAVLAESDDTVVVDETNPGAAWYDPAPKPAAVDIEGRVGFWRGVSVEGRWR